MPRAKPKKSSVVTAPPVAPSPVAPPVVEENGRAVKSSLPVVYDKVEITEYSSTSPHGPLTVEDIKTMLWWETEADYQKRMVEETPNSKPEHWLFGDNFHCLDTQKRKVRCWNNANNRPFDMAWCEDLIHTILYGQWAGPITIPGETINGETVRISRHGRILSGQHQGTALVLADEFLQLSRAQPSNAASPKYPSWNGYAHPVLETIVITGLSEDERVLQSIDYVKPRSLADMLYTTQLFRDNTAKERQELTRMLAAAAGMLWTRTDTKGYQTHTEMAEFLKRHKRLLDCVEHLFVENSSKGDDGGRKISKLRLSAGHASALCYLMACGSEKTTDYSDEYRNESPPSENNLDWSYWDRAQDFWTCLAGARDFMPVRTALGHLTDSSTGSEDNQGLGGRAPEKLAIIAKAWEIFKDHPASAGPPFSNEDLGSGGALCLSYSDIDDKGNKLPNGQIKLVDLADFFGIDCPQLGSGTKTAASRHSQPDPPAPVGEEYERMKEDALARRKEAQK